MTDEKAELYARADSIVYRIIEFCGPNDPIADELKQLRALIKELAQCE